MCANNGGFGIDISLGILSLESLTILVTNAEDNKPVADVAINVLCAEPDSAKILSTGFDGTVRVKDLTPGSKLVISATKDGYIGTSDNFTVSDASSEAKDSFVITISKELRVSQIGIR